MSAEDGLNPNQFGFLDHDPDLEEEAGDWRTFPKRFKEQEVPLHFDTLHPTQDYINPEGVQRYMKQDHIERNDKGELPVLIHHQGNTVVWNGHHRIAAALSNGQKSIKARVGKTRKLPKQ